MISNDVIPSRFGVFCSWNLTGSPHRRELVCWQVWKLLLRLVVDERLLALPIRVRLDFVVLVRREDQFCCHCHNNTNWKFAHRVFRCNFSNFSSVVRWAESRAMDWWGCLVPKETQMNFLAFANRWWVLHLRTLWPPRKSSWAFGKRRTKTQARIGPKLLNKSNFNKECSF